jgi:hypothetical protein
MKRGLKSCFWRERKRFLEDLCMILLTSEFVPFRPPAFPDGTNSGSYLNDLLPTNRPYWDEQRAIIFNN